MTDTHTISRCLVTGANGFLGGYLLERLQGEKIFTRALVRELPANALLCDEVITGTLLPDACCREWLDGIDTVFYLAGTAHLSADAGRYESDCLAALNLARQAAMRRVKHFVFVSTTKAASDPGENVCDEHRDVWPTEPYGYWKRKTEEQLSDIDIPHLAIVRPCLIYGAGVKGNLEKMIRAIDKGYFPPLPNTQSQRSMVFAGDVADALLLAATHPAAARQPLIVADGEPYTASDLYTGIRKALGKAPARWHIPLSLLKAAGVVGDILETLGIASPVSSDVVVRLTEGAAYSSTKLRQLGWESTTTFYRELPDMISAMHQKT